MQGIEKLAASNYYEHLEIKEADFQILDSISISLLWSEL